MSQWPLCTLAFKVIAKSSFWREPLNTNLLVSKLNALWLHFLVAQQSGGHYIRANIWRVLGTLFMLNNLILFHFISYVADFLETIPGKRQSWRGFG